MLDRSNPKCAEQAFALFAPHERARHLLESLLADSVRQANAEGTSCWEITLKNRELVFNVGQIALLYVRPGRLDLYYRWTPDLASPVVGSRAIGYSKRSVNARIRAQTLPLDGTLRIPKNLRDAHFAAIRAAAQAKSGTPWPYAHSPGVLEFLRRRGHEPMPDPAYMRARPSTQTVLLRPAVGAGFGDSEENAEVEAAAVRRAKQYYRDQGYVVRSVERDRVGHDLLCEKGRTKLLVEVKGVRGSRRRFLMTRGELVLSSHQPGFRLALVTNALSSKAVLTEWTAPEFQRDFDATAIQYSVRYVGESARARRSEVG